MLLSWLYNKIPDENKEEFAVGLAFGLAVGLAVGLAGIYNISFQYFIIVFLMIIVISEIFYWLDKHRWDDLGRWGNTIVKKCEALLETSLIVVNVCNLYNYGGDLLSWFGGKDDELNMLLSFVGWGTIIVLIIVGYVWFNSLKYKGD